MWFTDRELYPKFSLKFPKLTLAFIALLFYNNRLVFDHFLYVFAVQFLFIFFYVVVK